MKNNKFTSFISFFNAMILLLGALACNFNHNKHIDGGLKSLLKSIKRSELIEKNDIARDAKMILDSRESNFSKIDKSHRLEGVFTNDDEQKAKIWIRKNEHTISAVMSDMKKGIEEEIRSINALSKKAYEEKDLESASYRYSLVYYRLQYFKSNLSNVVENLSPLSMIIHSKSLANDQETLDFRKNLEKELLKIVGVGVVVNQDISKVKASIKKLNEVSAIDPDLKENLLRTDGNVAKTTVEKIKKYKLNESFCALNPNDNQCKRIESDRASLIEEFKNVTFLYTPGNKYFLITKILTIVGNLTWGLANTLIGAGVVLITMAVSPFTPYVDFPSFALASSGMQIYVDVTGISPLPGKLSMGLFELDNGLGYYYASEHEAGHAIQSAILGPLYLPTVLISYGISGFDEGFMEDSAWIMAEVSDYWL